MGGLVLAFGWSWGGLGVVFPCYCGSHFSDRDSSHQWCRSSSARFYTYFQLKMIIFFESQPFSP